MTYTKQELEEMMKKTGGSLDLRNTGITALPDNLTVGGSLYLRNTGIKESERKKVKGLFEGKESPNAWIYCDGMLVQYKRKKQFKGYTYYFGKIPGLNVIYDGTYYAHCAGIKEGVIDLEFKKAKNRGAEQYKYLSLESEISYNDAIVAYRIITGACQAGTKAFLDALEKKYIKETYTIAEIIDLTKGKYGNEVFKKIFTKE